MEIAFRGATVFFAAAFFDAGGAPASPSAVGIKINYIQNGVRKTSGYPMVFNIFTSRWEYDWNTAGISPCTVEWSVTSDPNTDPVYVDDGDFELSANAANLNQ